MNAQQIYEVVKKLTGKIDPYADAAIDSERRENLKVFIEVFDKMHNDIDRIATRNEDSKFSSSKEIGLIASDHLDRMGIDNGEKEAELLKEVQKLRNIINTPTGEIAKEIDQVIERHFKRFFREQGFNRTQNEWSALRRSFKKIVSDQLIKQANNIDVKNTALKSLIDPLTGMCYQSLESIIGKENCYNIEKSLDPK